MKNSTTLAWDTAKFADGTLEVEISGAFDHDWQLAFEQTIKRANKALRRRHWGSIVVHATTPSVTVRDVEKGYAEALKNYLSALVKSSNTIHEARIATAARAGQTTDQETQRIFRAA